MLTFYVVNVQGERHSLSLPAEVTLSRDIRTPADSLAVILPYIVEEELSQIYVYEKTEEIFCGVVDEQITIVGEDMKTKLVCRSMAALLIDNEAYPRTFNDMSMSLVFDRYAKPLGFTSYKGDDKTLRGEFRVEKGKCCWQVIEDFCKKTSGAFPCVEGKVINTLGANSKGESLVLSNKDMGIAYTNLEHNILRCSLLSRVRVKLTHGGEYSAFADDKDAQQRGVLRERFVNATDLSGKSLSDADRLLTSARLKSEKITLTVPGCFTQVLGYDACVLDSNAGDYSGFYVTGLRYRGTEKGEVTRLILMRKEN